MYFFLFKQMTAYEMLISDWSSDVCSSDLPRLDMGEWAAKLECRQSPGIGGGRITLNDDQRRVYFGKRIAQSARRAGKESIQRLFRLHQIKVDVGQWPAAPQRQIGRAHV